MDRMDWLASHELHELHDWHDPLDPLDPLESSDSCRRHDLNDALRLRVGGDKASHHCRMR
jgi:hypothetical protein